MILVLSGHVSPLVEGSKKHPCGLSRLYLMWNDTCTTGRSKPNCSVNNKKKFSCLVTPALIIYFFFYKLLLCFYCFCFRSLQSTIHNKCRQKMSMEDAMPLISLTGRRPASVWAKCFCMFIEDGWTMCFRENKNVAHKSLPRHRGQSEMVCKCIIVTRMAL